MSAHDRFRRHMHKSSGLCVGRCNHFCALVSRLSPLSSRPLYSLQPPAIKYKIEQRDNKTMAAKGNSGGGGGQPSAAATKPSSSASSSSTVSKKQYYKNETTPDVVASSDVKNKSAANSRNSSSNSSSSSSSSIFYPSSKIKLLHQRTSLSLAYDNSIGWGYQGETA